MARKSASFVRLTGGSAAAGFASTFAAAGAAAQEMAANGIETVVVTQRRPSIDIATDKVLDTPQSINVIPAEVIREQGVSSLVEALRNVPGVTLNAGEGGTHGDLVNLRGFSAGDDYFMDGLRDTGLYNRDAFDYDSIEVFKGPASTLFGRGSTGGVINQVMKAPELENFQNGALTVGTNSEIRGTADVNWQFADTAALRIAAMGQTNDVEGRPFVHTDKWGIAPSIAVGLGTDTVAWLKYLHQEDDNLPDYGIPFVFGKPAPVDRDTFYGLPKDDAFDTDVDVLTGRVEHTFNDVFSIADTARYGNYRFDSRQTAPIYGTANCYTAPPYPGAPDCATTATPKPVSEFNPLYPVLGTPLDQTFVLRDRPSSLGTIRTWMNNTTVTAKFDTGGLHHTLVFGAEYDRETASLTRFVNQDDSIEPAPLLRPDPHQPIPNLHQTTVRQRPVTKTETIGFFASDTIDIGEHWSVIGAVRWDHFHATFDQTVGTQQHFQHTDEIASPRAAIVYKPAKSASIYFTYGTSYNPSAENLSLAASNQGLSPEKDRTFELGGKVQVMDNKLALTAALFDTTMTNARITDPVVPSLQTLAGELRVKGFEFGAQGYLTEHLEIIAGYTYLDTNAHGLAGPGVDAPIPNTARHQANLWLMYDVNHDIEFGAGANYVGRRDAGTDNLTNPGHILVAHVPSYVTVDAMGSYRINDHIQLQLNGYNVFDKHYYATSYFTRPNENHAVPGIGRSFLLTANVSL